MDIKVLKIPKNEPEQLEIRCHEVTEQISENCYGAYSPAVKNVLDRSIGSSTPLSTYRGKQMHHTLRYGKHKLYKVYTYGDITPQEKETFDLMAERNALNDGYEKSEVIILKSVRELEDMTV